LEEERKVNKKIDRFAGVSQPQKSDDMGDWEKYTKGIGSKLMQKMGYETGKGLGKSGNEGVTVPLQPSARPKGMGLGSIDEKHAMGITEKKESVVKPVAQVPKEAVRLQTWKRDIAKAGIHKKSKLVDQLLTEKQPEKQVIIDMTGSTPKVLTSLSKKQDQTDTFMPALKHNIRLLVDLAEISIQNNDRKMRNEREMIIKLKREKDRLKKQL